MLLKNIKASFWVEKKPNLNKIECVTKHSLYLYRLHGLVFTIYKHKQDRINVTGIDSIKQLRMCSSLIKLKFDTSVYRFKIDSMMFSEKNQLKIDIVGVIQFLNKKYKNIFRTSFTNELFPALFIKPTAIFKKEGPPTIILFSSGSFVLIGAKNMKIVKKIHVLLNFIKTVYMIK